MVRKAGHGEIPGLGCLQGGQEPRHRREDLDQFLLPWRQRGLGGCYGENSQVKLAAPAPSGLRSRTKGPSGKGKGMANK